MIATIKNSHWLNKIKEAYENMPYEPLDFFTLTFRKEVKPAKARHYVKRHFQMMSKISDTHIDTMASIGYEGCRVHIHGVRFVEDKLKLINDFKWQYGRCEFEPYNRTQGGLIYCIHGGYRKHQHYPFEIITACPKNLACSPGGCRHSIANSRRLLLNVSKELGDL